MFNIENLLDQILFLQENLLLKQLLIIVFYSLLAKLADIFMDRVLIRFIRRAKIHLDDALFKPVHGPLCWTIFFIGLLHALTVRPLPPPWESTLPALIKSIMLLSWWVAIFGLVNLLVNKNVDEVLARGKIGHDLFLMLKNIIRVISIVLGLLWLLSIWEVNLTPIFASAGIAGIAIALAAKDTLANFFGGISIFMDKTYKVGDYIILDNSERGEVVDVGIRSTRLKTRDDVLITVPNSIIATSKIINESAPGLLIRVRLPIGVAYGSDLDQVERVLLEAANANPNVAKDPGPVVRVRAFGASSLDLELLFWVGDPRVKGFESHILLKSIYKEFYVNNIIIPFPQMDVHWDRKKE